jgi:hypothetical protein
MRSLGIGLLVLVALDGAALTHSGTAGLPGYVEWVIWEETVSVAAQAAPGRTFRWVVGPYPRRVDCELDRDRLATRAVQAARRDAMVVTRLLCVPDTVNPSEDSRGQ